MALDGYTPMTKMHRPRINPLRTFLRGLGFVVNMRICPDSLRRLQRRLGHWMNLYRWEGG